MDPTASTRGADRTARGADRRRQCRSQAVMTDQHEAEPAATAATAATATADGTGAPAPGRPRGRLPMTGSMIIHAVTEGHSAVITILAVFVALVIGAVLIVASD